MRLSPAKPIFRTDTLELLPSPKRVCAVFGGKTVADSRRAAMLFEKGHLPLYYFPKDDVDMALLTPTEHRSHCPRKGDASYWTLTVNGKRAENAAWAYPEPLAGAAGLADYLTFYWDKLDAWFEEDERLYAHPRDPYHRVDTRRSSRHVRVVHAGEVIAETRRPTLLFETDLPTRYYLPEADVNWARLEPSQTTASCPYKGEASYYGVRVGDALAKDLVWTYRQPLAEALEVRGMLCFYHEKLDEVSIDGEQLG
ncbi:MAG: DUF427 domain-containing protein [Deinococcota bacterium]|jgi:uncharacterized protein (DUF427 family)|nr:DUF427 domain-containing protein [Deinococcota bacterium]